MEEEATQQATQLVIDPRRLGHGNSGMKDEDLADIFCILHPTSSPAYRAATQIRDSTPHHTISFDSNVKIHEKNKDAHSDVDSFELESQGLASCDIALRLSANLKDPLGGYQFGRNPARCDFVIGQFQESRRISNIHFRIYINEYGVIMLEDQSTNGTVINGHLLRAKEKENGKDYRHTLENGSIIILTMTPPEKDFRFIVRIPQRDDDCERIYEQNLTAFFLRRNNAALEKRARTAAVAGGGKDPLNLFPTTDVLTEGSSASVGRYVKEWKGGAKYNKICCIGKGAFAIVYKVTAKFDGVPYAAKELEKRRFMKNGVLDQKVDMEMKIMRKIQHPNIVRFVEHIDWEEYLYIIMEFVPGGNLGGWINEHGHIPEIDVNAMAGQLLSALKYLHEGGITHRDIKPDNILICTHQPFNVKLTDFGLSKMIDSEETFLRTFCGTLLYCAPEVYSEYREYDQHGRRNFRGMDRKFLPPQRYGHAVDIWSLAGVLFFALCGSPPYPVRNGTSYQELLNQIMTQPLDIRPLQRIGISERGIKFVKSMLQTRPEYRATITELERSSWLTGDDSGDDSMSISMEEDEVDMIADGFVDPELEEGTSQLSLHNSDRQIDDSEEMGSSGLTEIQQLEIPSSFNTSGSSSKENEGFEFINAPGNHGNGGRLFGEVNASAVGSSGAIPFAELNLPVPIARHREMHSNSDISHDSMYTQSEPSHDSARVENSSRQLNSIAATTMPVVMPPPPPPATIKNQDLDERAARSSSLMGTESLVGHLNMHSPASASSPAADTSAPTTESREATVSLRRPREEDSNDDEGWRPHDLPSKRRRKSEREIEMPLPPSTFWDPRDKSTHHNNYPRMTTSDYRAYQEYAEKKGEKFEAGQKTFEMTMNSFKTSRSPSAEPEIATRAHSEPTVEEGRRMLMKRDERKLSDTSEGQATETDPDATAQDKFIPSTVHTFSAFMSGALNPDAVDASVTSPNAEPVVGNDFQPPKRILAKIIATPDCCLPTISLNITEPVTSWGRGNKATVRYSNGHETRIPKYAFKVLLFKPGFYSSIPSTPSSSARESQTWNDKDQDMAFYISSKASSGIWVNGIRIPSHDRQNPYTPSKFWGELRHGDVITVWRDDIAKNQFVRFRFECLWGKSREARKEGEVFEILKEGDTLSEIEQACLSQEKEILVEQERLDAEENKMMELEKQREKLARERRGDNHNNFHQSFVGAAPTVK